MSDIELFDLLIVGAGPAGLSAARTAARLGFRTLVVDRLAARYSPAGILARMAAVCQTRTRIVACERGKGRTRRRTRATGNP